MRLARTMIPLRPTYSTRRAACGVWKSSISALHSFSKMVRPRSNKHYAYWLSMGMEDERAGYLAHVQTSLTISTDDMETIRQRQAFHDSFNYATPEHLRGGRIVLDPTIYGLSDELLLHDAMMEEWNKFAAAFSTVATGYQGSVFLSLTQVQLDGEVAAMFLDAFPTCPLTFLSLENCDGWNFATNTLKLNPRMVNLTMDGNPVESDAAAVAFAEALLEHPKMVALDLRHCDLGRSKDVLSAIVPVLQNCWDVSFEGNDIGFHGATLVANYIATNPLVRKLNLMRNMLQDDSASVLAQLLETNTNLLQLSMFVNKFSKVGYSALIDAVTGPVLRDGLNALMDCNHTCSFDIADCNPMRNPRDNLMHKLLMFVQCNPHFLSDVPVKLMPKLLVLIQVERPVRDNSMLYAPLEADDAKLCTALEAVFRVVREFSSTIFSSIARNTGQSVSNHALEGSEAYLPAIEGELSNRPISHEDMMDRLSLSE